MNKFMNAPENFVAEMLEGIALANKYVSGEDKLLSSYHSQPTRVGGRLMRCRLRRSIELELRAIPRHIPERSVQNDHSHTLQHAL